MLTNDPQARNDEAWGRGPGTASSLERMAELDSKIATTHELLAKPDWYFGGRAVAWRERLLADAAGFEVTLGELMERHHAD